MFAPGRIHELRPKLWKYEETDNIKRGTSFSSPFIAGVVAWLMSAGVTDVHYVLNSIARKNEVQPNMKSNTTGLWKRKMY